MDWDHDIDALGLLCPLPVLRAGRQLRAMAPGEVLRLRATDPVAAVDVPHFCAETGNAYLGSEDHADGAHYFIRKA